MFADCLHTCLDDYVCLLATVLPVQPLEGDTLVYVVALRNLLAYSQTAKAAALSAGLHTSLLHCCLLATHMLSAAERKAAASKCSISHCEVCKQLCQLFNAINHPVQRGLYNNLCCSFWLLSVCL
jgi:hypothetical protein